MNAYEKNHVEKIRGDYAPPREKKRDRLQALEKLDKKVKRPPFIIALTFGIISCLILGFGMCLAMKVIFDLMIPGIVIGLAGILLLLLNYPLYKAILKRRRKKYAPEILALTDSLLAGESN